MHGVQDRDSEDRDSADRDSAGGDSADLDSEGRRQTVALLWYPGALLTSLTLAQEMLAAANSVLRARRRSPAWRVVLWVPQSRSGGPAAETGPRGQGAAVGGRALEEALGLRSMVTLGEEETPPLVVVPAFWGNPLRLLARSTALCRRITDAPPAIWIGVGSGAFLLGEAGLLDGRAATTHWSQLDRFARRFPHASLRRDHRIVESGDVFTVASLNALADLIVYLIGRTAGEEIGRTIERHFSYESRNPFAEEVFSDRTPHNVADELVAEAQSWIHENLTRPFEVAELARHLRVSRRTLDRRFRGATGQSIVRYRNRARIELGAEMLRATDLAVGEVAERCGVQDGRYFARVFREVLGLAPREYRRVVRAKLFRRE